MRGVMLSGLALVGAAVAVGCGGSSTGGGRTDGAAGSATASGGTTSSGSGGAAGSATTPSSGGTGSPSSGGSTGDGGTGTGGAGAATVADLCPELVAANCAALSTYLSDVATCAATLPMLAMLCQTEADELLACTGPDPDITCDAAGVPTSVGCEAEWSAVMTCIAQLMAGGGGG